MPGEYGFIVWIIVGGLAGWIASKFMGTDAQQGILLNIVVGVVGAFLGGFILSLITDPSGFGIILTFVTAIVGACILLAIVKAVSGRSSKV